MTTPDMAPVGMQVITLVEKVMAEKDVEFQR
jgi:hypothetical protein